MNSGSVLPILFICTLLLRYNGVEGRDLKLWKEEDFELEERLKLLNKPAIKTVHTANGYIYDCVDFYKQPAFDHPSLQNYTIHLDQVKSTPVNGDIRDPFFGVYNIDIKLKDGGCPIGTVPIRRITKDDLIRERLASKFRSLVVGEFKYAHYAVVRTKPGPKYAGAGGAVTLYKPRTIDAQYSAARFLLKNGPDSIEIGWRVDPVLYGDNECRLSLRTTMNGKACFGVRCPGFVITNEKVDIEGSFTPSVRGNISLIYEVNFKIIRDQSGNWVLTGGPDLIQIGYWPKSIFMNEGLKQLASYIEWGGEVFSPEGTPKPPMGSSFFPEEDSEKDCFYNNMTIVNESGQEVIANDVEAFADSPTSYKVIDDGDFGFDIGYVILFGGPGGNF